MEKHQADKLNQFRFDLTPCANLNSEKLNPNSRPARYNSASDQKRCAIWYNSLAQLEPKDAVQLAKLITKPQTPHNIITYFGKIHRI